MYKILIVDDMSEWRNVNGNIISNIFQQNYEIIYANSALDGFNTAVEHKRKPFDIILTDLQMEDDFAPEYAGEWFVKSLKGLKEYESSCIVIISATSDINKIAKRTNTDYISKQRLYYNPHNLKYILEERGFIQ